MTPILYLPVAIFGALFLVFLVLGVTESSSNEPLNTVGVTLVTLPDGTRCATLYERAIDCDWKH